ETPRVQVGYLGDLVVVKIIGQVIELQGVLQDLIVVFSLVHPVEQGAKGYGGQADGHTADKFPPRGKMRGTRIGQTDHFLVSEGEGPNDVLQEKKAHQAQGK